jgi:hypothetical protein
VNLRKSVIKSEKNDFEDMGGAVEAMRNINRHFKTGTLPNTDFSLKDLEDYVYHLISIQEKDGSWTVSASPEQLAGDEKIEFITYPSFLALGTLVMAPDYLTEKLIEGREESLKKGFASLRLEGYGEDSLFQIIEMVLMLIEAGVPPWLKEREDDKDYQEFITSLISLREKVHSRLEKGDTTLSFGGDYRSIFELVTSGLSVLRRGIYKQEPEK